MVRHQQLLQGTLVQICGLSVVKKGDGSTYKHTNENNIFLGIMNAGEGGGI